MSTVDIDNQECTLNNATYEWGKITSVTINGEIFVPKATLKAELLAKSFDVLADEMVEKKYQLRVEHNHGDMKWYAYYAGKEGRRLFDDDGDWDTASPTPTEALQKLKTYFGDIDE